MNVKNILLSLTIAGVLLLCAFNSVAATEASGGKFSPYKQGNLAPDVNGRQQTDIIASASLVDPYSPGPNLRLQVGSPVEIVGVLSPCSIPNPTLILQRLNVGNGTWSTITPDRTQYWSTGGHAIPGEYMMYITPREPGVWTYRVLYNGDSNYAPAVSNEITLTVSNFPSKWL